MGPILMAVAAVVLGWFIQPRLMAYVAYLAVFSLAFTFQSVVLITQWAGGSTRAFGHFPKASDVDSYGVVNLLFLVVGCGILTLVHHVADRRRAGQAVSVSVPANG